MTQKTLNSKKFAPSLITMALQVCRGEGFVEFLHGAAAGDGFPSWRSSAVLFCLGHGAWFNARLKNHQAVHPFVRNAKRTMFEHRNVRHKLYIKRSSVFCQLVSLRIRILEILFWCHRGRLDAVAGRAKRRRWTSYPLSFFSHIFTAGFCNACRRQSASFWTKESWIMAWWLASLKTNV